MDLSKRQLHALTHALDETHDFELTCDEYLDLVAAYAELRARGEPIPASLEQVLAHERLCAACREETAALIELLARP